MPGYAAYSARTSTTASKPTVVKSFSLSAMPAAIGKTDMILTIISNIPGIAKIIGALNSSFKYFSLIWDLKAKERLSQDYFQAHIEKVYNTIETFVLKLRVASVAITRREKERIIGNATTRHSKKHGEYRVFNTEDMEQFMLKEFLRGAGPKNINNFLRFVFFYENSNSKLYVFRLFWERIKSKLFFKDTFYHYMSIPRWNSLSRAQLLEQLGKISEVSPYLTGFYDFRRSKLKTSERDSNIFRVISAVIKDGFLSEDTLLKLSASQKFLIVHKYSEGMSGLVNEDRTQIENLRAIVQKNEDSDDPKERMRAEKALRQIEKIEARKTRVPLGVALEKKGFIKLFRNMSGVYVYPLWKLQSEYQTDPNLFFEKEVFPAAQEELLRNQEKDSRIRGLGGNLKYVVLYHIVSVKQLHILESERDFSLSSPKLSKSLLVSFLHENPNNLSSIYVNNIIQNVSFWSFVSLKNKTGKFLAQKKDEFERLLFAEGCDPSLPMTLVRLSEMQISKICNTLIGKSRRIRPQDLKKLVNKQKQFYHNLQNELNSLHQK